MQNIVSLKMLNAHDGAQSFYCSNNYGEAVMIVIKPNAFAYDREHYPDADCICIISSDDPALTAGLLDEIEAKQKVVFN